MCRIMVLGAWGTIVRKKKKKIHSPCPDEVYR